LEKIKIMDYRCGLAIKIVGLGLYSYYVRELLASLVLFSAVFAGIAFIVLGGVLAWYASKQIALWSGLGQSASALPLGVSLPVASATNPSPRISPRGRRAV
jgi:hypothetical protein